ncbi:hypothetical protein BRO54_1152 [Geobacillus proteiniphilus]|uniref:Uncharacterized protein n=1 Tax=Geobacillus proteiniphilus TaxID=860353 RepID=A0A1Q5T4M2_9BACL|nr:hypothetical protein BRO54_1152 [Geobacillus proteiniphilus]
MPFFSVAKWQREKIAKTLEKSGLALDYGHGVMVIFYLKSLFW